MVGSFIEFSKSLLDRRASREEDELLCACNSTYTSNGCCGAGDGLVWESPEEQVDLVGLLTRDN